MSNREYFRLPTLAIDAGEIGVDRTADAIRGVAIMQVGDISPVDGRKYFVDDVTVQQFVSLAKDGMRARYAENPETHGEGMGTYLGKWSAARADSGKARMDLTLSPRSHDSPRGDIGKYTIEMAESDPDMLGASMVVSLDRAAMNKSRRTDGFSPVRIKAVHGADIVDTPALVSGMFAVGQNSGDDEMSDAITKEQFDAGLKASFDSLGKSLADSITADVMAKVEEKFSASRKEGEKDEPTPDDLRKQGAKLASEIMAFAATSGLNDHAKLASEAIDAGQTVEAFKAGLADRLVAQNKLSKDGGESPDDDPHAKFRAEFKAGREQFATVGVIDEEAFVRSRCRDEGLPVPEIKKAG